MPFWPLCCESEAILFKKFRPGHRAGVFIWKNFHPGYREPGQPGRPGSYEGALILLSGVLFYESSNEKRSQSPCPGFERGGGVEPGITCSSISPRARFSKALEIFGPVKSSLIYLYLKTQTSCTKRTSVHIKNTCE